MITGIISIFGITVTIVLFELSWKRKRVKSFNDICTHFRSAFLESIAELSICSNDIHFIMSRARTNHEAAIDEFRRHMPQRKLTQFDAAVSEYRILRDSTEPSLLRYYRERATGVPLKDQRSECTELLIAINRMLSFAKPK
jgi:hypothetical protein